MRFLEIFRFELALRLRQPSTWVYLALLVALAVLRADSVDTDLVRYHAPVHAAFSTLMVGVFATLVTAGLFVEAGQRDLRARIQPFFSTVPLRRRDYLGGRFAGTLVVNALLLLAVPSVLLIGGGLESFAIGSYLLPYAAFLLPNLLINAAVLFGVTVLTRSALPGYLGALALTMAYLVAVAAGSRHGSALWGLVDPTGAVALARLTDGWTRADLNKLPIPVDGLLLWNRVLWTTLGAGMLALTMSRFRAHPADGGSERRREAEPRQTAPVRPMPPVAQSFGLTARLRQIGAVAAFELRQLVLRREFLLIALGLFGVALTTVAEVWLYGGVLHWPLTHSVTADLTSRWLVTIVVIITVFVAGELVWRERDAGVEKLVDSAPLRDWVSFAGKLLALGLTLILLQGVLMAAGFAAQALQGYFRFEPLLYVRMLFGVQLAELLPFAVLALLVHVIVDQKYVGHMIAILLYVGTLQAPNLGIEHNLLVFGSDPGLTWSDFNGFGPFLVPFVWFKLYWLAWTLLLTVAALLFWRRGADGGLRARVRAVRHRWTARVAAAVAVAALLVLATGGFIFYNTNVLSEYRTARETEARHAEYERRYKRFEHLPQPAVASVRLHAELFPDRRRATLRATYGLVNRTGAPIGTIHLSSLPHPEVTLRSVRFDRPARAAVDDAAHGYRIYTLGRALGPGQSAQLQFELAIAPCGFRNREQPSASMAIVGPFTSLGSWLMPAIGYQREAMELSSAAARREHGLPPNEVRPSIDDLRARQIPRIPRLTLEAVIATNRDHVAVVPGALQRSWIEGDRRLFHYRTEAPVLDFFSIVSSPYAVREARWENVQVRVLHHPRHRVNVDRVVRAAQISLGYHTRELGPYPHRQLDLVEIPRYSSGARAYGGQIVYSESSPMAAARVEADAIDDAPLTLAAHEIAHQWWGQQVMGADVQGSQMLSETLAQYSAMSILERTRGAEATRRILRRMHGSYLDGRGRHETPETPLVLTADHSHLHYGKGAVVMHTLQDVIGEERVNAALRRFFRANAMQGPPYATTLDLYRELREDTPEPLRPLLHDLLATITVWDLRTTAARAESTGNGEYRVTLDIEGAKFRSDPAGNHTAVPMNDPVDVVVFAGDGQPLYSARHRIRSGRQTITVAVRGTPVRAGIDPYHKLLVRHSDALYDRKVKVADVER